MRVTRHKERAKYIFCLKLERCEHKLENKTGRKEKKHNSTGLEVSGGDLCKGRDFFKNRGLKVDGRGCFA